MNLSIVGGTAALNALNALYSGGTLTIYSGTMPATPETSATGTALVSFTFSGTAFAAPVHSSPNMTATATFTNASPSPTAAGTAGYARAFESGGTVLADYSVGSLVVWLTSGVPGRYYRIKIEVTTVDTFNVTRTYEWLVGMTVDPELAPATPTTPPSSDFSTPVTWAAN